MRESLWLALVLCGCARIAEPATLLPGQITPQAATAPISLTLRGRVLDSTGAPLPGAKVTLVPNGLRVNVTAVSTVADTRGDFVVSLAAISYVVRVQADGFAEFTQHLNATQVAEGSHDFVLQVAGLKERVTVTAQAGYETSSTRSATKTNTLLRDVPQSVTVISKELIRDQLMTSIREVVTYVPGITAHQGENNRDDLVIRGNRSSADFFVDGVRDDVQYYRDLYNLDRVEALKGPNAMIFGRGGGGGVVNRVVKEASFQPLRSGTLQLGSFDNLRATADLSHPFSNALAMRVNGMFEDSASFRSGVRLERTAVNPTVTVAPNAETKLTVGYEYLRDTRVADRGITSFQGAPATVDPTTFYGRPEDSHVRARVHIGSALFEHRFSHMNIRNRTLVGNYDRFYQNFVPGAVTSDRSQVALTAYNNASVRANIFNQTDITATAKTGALQHTLLVGLEFGRQATENFRRSGFFDNSATSILVPFDAPTTAAPVTFRQSATDANNRVRAKIGAVFAQDQIQLTRVLQILGGIRADRFDLTYHNNRNDETLQRIDVLVSPRAGLVFKPIEPVSLYGSYSVSSLPSSGDQFSSLTAVTQQLEPEHFTNVEIGAKWDLRPTLSLTTALYRVDRTNSRSTDPNDPTRIVQTGSQRTNGVELGVNGALTPAWRIAGGYAYQDAFVTSATAAARTGAQVGQVPHHTWSLWNQYRVHHRVAAALGLVHRSDMYAAIDNTVALPGYTRADAAAFLAISKAFRLQANVENVLDRRYFVNADGNTNISPGAPRALRIALSTVF